MPNRAASGLTDGAGGLERRGVERIGFRIYPQEGRKKELIFLGSRAANKRLSARRKKGGGFSASESKKKKKGGGEGFFGKDSPIFIKLEKGRKKKKREKGGPFSSPPFS